MKKDNSGTVPNDFVVIFFVFAFSAIIFGSVFDRFDNWLHDYWLNLRLRFSLSKEDSSVKKLLPGSGPSREIVLVIVDDRSILGIPGLFEGNRSHYAKVIKKLAANNPAGGPSIS